MIKPVVSAVIFVMGLLLWTGPAGAAEPCTAFDDDRVDPAIVAAMREAGKEGRLYQIDASVSKVGFCVRHFPFQEFRGEFSNVVGGLALPPDPARHGQALLLIHTSSLRSDNPALVPIVRGSHFMDTTNYPEILYVGRRFKWLNAAQAHIYGELTVRGRTLPVIFDVELDVPGDREDGEAERIRLRGLSHVSRFNFGMRSHRFFVSETIQLCLGVELVRWVPEP